MIEKIIEKSVKIKNLFPFLEWIWELKDKNVLKADFIAWISVALVLIPQSMAYARLAWLPPIMWLYAAFIPTMIAWLFWSSRQSSTWPSAVISLLTATSLTNILPNTSEWYIFYATFMALIVWVFQIILWITHMGVIIKFFSHPVVRGFTNAAAIMIILSQIPDIFWIKVDDWEYLFETAINIVKNLKNTNIIAFLIWLLSFVSILYFKIFRSNLPWVIIVIILTTFVSWFTWFWWIIWEIPKWLPIFHIPRFDLTIILQVITSAAIIGSVGFMESISIAKTLAIKTDNDIDVNQELIGQGIANVSSWLFWWFPVAGSFSRSAIANNMNAKTWFFSVISWIIVAFTLLFLTPILYYIPKVTLAVIIIIAVSRLITFKPFIKAWKVEPHDCIVWIITFIWTLLLAPNLEKWILIWVFVSLFLFLYRTMTPRFIEVSRYKDWSLRDAQKYSIQTSKNIWIYRFDGSLYFANSEYFSDKLFNFIEEKKEIKLLILDFEWLNDMDYTWINILEKTIRKIKSKNIEVYIMRPKLQIKKALERVDFIEYFGEDKLFYSLKDALKYSLKDFDDLDKKPLRKYIPIKTNET